MRVSRVVSVCMMSMVSLSCLFAEALASPPGPGPGFKAFRWGDAPLFHMDRVDRREGMDVYFLPDDPDRFAGIRTASIRYLFRNGGLCRVEVDWRKALGRREYQTLLASLTRQWGKPDEKLGPGSLLWRSEPAGTEAKLLSVDSAVTPWADYDTLMVLQSLDCP